MPSESPRLSKSRYLSGLQCHKQLWWRVHEPEAPELSPTPGQENLFAQGREVGARARAHIPPLGEQVLLPRRRGQLRRLGLVHSPPQLLVTLEAGEIARLGEARG